MAGRMHDRASWRRVSVLHAFLAVALAGTSLCCATMRDEGQPLVPTRYQLRSGPFVVLSNFPMTDDPPAVRCLAALDRDLKEHLAFEPGGGDDPVEIYVLDSRNAFAHFLKFYYPELPPRRAFFLAQGPQRVVYTYASPRLEEDLRHEATHALLHGAFGDLPLWLDEGLAEYFEDDLVLRGTERTRLDLINKDLAGGWVPDLARLESLADIREMTPRDYREAWAWVHLLLNGPGGGSSALLTTLGESAEAPAKLRFSNQGVSTDRLLAHLKALDAHLTAVAAQPGDRSVRLQDRAVMQASVSPPAPAPSPSSSASPAVSPSSPRGFFQRVRTWLGW